MIVPASAGPIVETPEVKRRRLRGNLRRAREAVGLTQKVAASELHWSTSKLIRIEQGAVPVVPTDVEALLRLYQVTDAQQVKDMVALAIDARDSAWVDKYRDVYTASALSLFGNEPAANVIYKYTPTFVPGLFQTSEYARALLRALGYSDREVRQKLAARLARQKLLNAEIHPELAVVLGEAVVSRPIGGPEIMLEQVERLKELARQPGISLQILPFSAGAHRAMGEPFTVLLFDDKEIGDLVYLEDAGQESKASEEPETLERYLDIFVELRERASAPEDFAEAIDAVALPRFGPTGANGHAV